MQYSCCCPKRTYHESEAGIQKKKISRRKALEEMVDCIKKDGEKNLGETIQWLQDRIIETFKDSAFNQCENQKLQMLKGTKMKVLIKEEATPKRQM